MSGIRRGEIEREGGGDGEGKGGVEERESERDQRGLEEIDRGGGGRREEGETHPNTGGGALCCRGDHSAPFIRRRDGERKKGRETARVRALHSFFRRGDRDMGRRRETFLYPLPHIKSSLFFQGLVHTYRTKRLQLPARLLARSPAPKLYICLRSADPLMSTQTVIRC